MAWWEICKRCITKHNYLKTLGHLHVTCEWCLQCDGIKLGNHVHYYWSSHPSWLEFKSLLQFIPRSWQRSSHCTLTKLYLRSDVTNSMKKSNCSTSIAHSLFHEINFVACFLWAGQSRCQNPTKERKMIPLLLLVSGWVRPLSITQTFQHFKYACMRN